MSFVGILDDDGDTLVNVNIEDFEKVCFTVNIMIKIIVVYEY